MALLRGLQDGSDFPQQKLHWPHQTDTRDKMYGLVIASSFIASLAVASPPKYHKNGRVHVQDLPAGQGMHGISERREH